MHKVISEFKIGSYLVLKLSEELPTKEYHKYKIDNVEYDIVPVYDMPQCIAIIGTGSFLDKSVEFI